MRFAILGGLALLVAVIATIVAALMAIVGANLSCGIGGGTAEAASPPPTKTALREIPSARLTIYREAGSALDISWPFLASIGAQECGHGACHEINPSGCAGPMEIAYVRGSVCSPDPAVPTIWERFKTDGDGDGKTSIFDPADAVFTAAKILRKSDGAPPAGGTYAAYRQAACNYYGACGDAVADYAAEVMARAVEYGFGGAESEVSEPEGTGAETKPGERPRHPPPSPSGSTCEASTATASGSEIVRIAESQIGTTEQPLGSNCQKYGPCEEWCALFVAWVWERAGVALEGGTAPFAYSGVFYTWVTEHGGRDLPPTATPAPGDAVMYGTGVAGFQMEHVGIVERVFPNGEITTIEGNFADNVARVGPFDPAHAEAAGEPAPIFAYAEPPTARSHEAESELPKRRAPERGVTA
jgi:hypothetical protein